MLLPSEKKPIENIELTELEIRLLFALRVLIENNLDSNSDKFEIDNKKYKILVTNDKDINITIKSR
jgi:hypothetical protein